MAITDKLIQLMSTFYFIIGMTQSGEITSQY